MDKKTKQQIQKKIENILNKYYKDTGKEIFNIKVFRVLNKMFNYKFRIEFKEQEVLKNKK